jgi:hypothetical protein
MKQKEIIERLREERERIETHESCLREHRRAVKQLMASLLGTTKKAVKK